jgi:hypothetical protein
METTQLCVEHALQNRTFELPGVLYWLNLRPNSSVLTLDPPHIEQPFRSIKVKRTRPNPKKFRFEVLKAVLNLMQLHPSRDRRQHLLLSALRVQAAVFHGNHNVHRFARRTIDCAMRQDIGPSV